MNGTKQNQPLRAGLCEAEVEASRLKYGSNALTQKKGKSPAFSCRKRI